MPDHSVLTGTQNHIPWNYKQDSDPGAIGADATWVDTSGSQPVWKVRNAGDTDWEVMAPAVYASSGGGAPYVVASADASTDLKALADVVCDGVSDHLDVQAGLTAGRAVLLVGSNFSWSAPVTLATGDVVYGVDSVNTVVTYSGTNYAFKIGTAGADVKDVRIEGFKLLSSVAGTLGGIDLRGMWRCNVERMRITNFLVGILGGGDGTSYGEASGNTIRDNEMTSNTTGIKIAGTVTGVAGTTPMGNRWRIENNTIAMNSSIGNAVGIDLVDADTTVIDGNDIGYGTTAWSIFVRANGYRTRIVNNTFEYSAQTAGYYPIEIASGSGLDTYLAGNGFSNGATQPHVQDNNAVANRRWSQLDQHEFNTEFADGYWQSYLDFIYWRGIHIRATSGAAAINFRRTSDSYDRFRIDNNGALRWVDPADNSAGPILSPRSTSAPVILAWSDDALVAVPKTTSLPSATAARVRAMVMTDGGGTVNDHVYICRRLSDGSYEWFDLTSPTVDTNTAYTFTQIQTILMAGGTDALKILRTSESYPRIALNTNGHLVWRDPSAGSETAQFQMTSTGGPIILAWSDDSHVKPWAKDADGSLPSANSTRRGVVFRTEGASTVADRHRIASKKQDDSYLWHDLHPLLFDVTVDFASTADKASDTQTVTCTGSAVLDGVVVGVPAAFADGCSVFGKVTATDTVKLTFMNLSGGVVDPASATYRVQIHKGS